MHLGTLALILIVLFSFEELFRLAASHLLDGLVSVLIAFAVLGLAYLSTVPAYAAWTWLKHAVGPDAANRIADPLCFVVAVGVPWLLYADSRQEFAGTVWMWRKLTRRAA